MKNLCLIFTLICFSFSGFAQKDNTLFGSSGLRLTGIWGGPVMNFSYFDNDFAPVTGGYIGLEFNKSVFLGYGNYELQDAVNYNIGGLVTPDFYLSYQGAILGYAPFAHKIVHPTVMVLAGPGETWIAGEGSDKLFVVQPSVGVEVNVFRWARIGLDGGYRFVADSDLESLTNDQLSTFYGELKLKFGWSWGRNKRKFRRHNRNFDDEFHGN